MVVAEDVRAPRMAEDGSADADLPECDCDVTRQASSCVSLLGIALELRGAHGIDTRLFNLECFKLMLSRHERHWEAVGPGL